MHLWHLGSMSLEQISANNLFPFSLARVDISLSDALFVTLFCCPRFHLILYMSLRRTALLKIMHKRFSDDCNLLEE